MNVILFETEELSKPLNIRDHRAKHILKVLRLNPGETFKMGVINGKMGEGIFIGVDEQQLNFSFELKYMPKSLYPLTLIAGFVRPNSVKRILRDATSLGVERIVWTPTELTEKSYRNSHIWDEKYQRPLLLEGAIQAYSSLLPEIVICQSFDEALNYCSFDEKIALDHIDPDASLSSFVASRALANKSVGLAIGSERGWTSNERDFLQTSGFKRLSMGDRVLRLIRPLWVG